MVFQMRWPSAVYQFSQRTTTRAIYPIDFSSPGLGFGQGTPKTTINISYTVDSPSSGFPIRKILQNRRKPKKVS